MGNKKILAVDDSASIRKSISFVLSQENYEVIEAVDGIDGLSKAKSEKSADISRNISVATDILLASGYIAQTKNSKKIFHNLQIVYKLTWYLSI